MPTEKANPDSKQWKNSVNGAVVVEVAKQISLVERSFDRAGFIKAVDSDDLEGRELKDRVAMITRHLHDFLPEDYSRTVEILLAVAPELNGWGNWVLTSYVELYGVDYLELSVRAMKELTKRSSCEFAVRPYMMRYTDQMLRTLDHWTGDSNEHVRRLAAEGSRPRGVWMPHIESFKTDPRPVIKILDKLRADDSLYVRKAVANNLNDISKDNPGLAIKTALRWQKDKNAHTDWIIKHGCRTLIKQGHPDVFPLLGYTANPKVKVTGLKVVPAKVRIGGEIKISFDLESLADKKQHIVIDYNVHYVKKNGKTSAKVFKLTSKKLTPRQTVALSTGHSFQERSTRRHYPGTHRLEILVNGSVTAGVDFLVAD